MICCTSPLRHHPCCAMAWKITAHIKHNRRAIGTGRSAVLVLGAEVLWWHRPVVATGSHVVTNPFSGQFLRYGCEREASIVGSYSASNRAEKAGETTTAHISYANYYRSASASRVAALFWLPSVGCWKKEEIEIYDLLRTAILPATTQAEASGHLQKDLLILRVIPISFVAIFLEVPLRPTWDPLRFAQTVQKIPSMEHLGSLKWPLRAAAIRKHDPRKTSPSYFSLSPRREGQCKYFCNCNQVHYFYSNIAVSGSLCNVFFRQQAAVVLMMDAFAYSWFLYFECCLHMQYSFSKE